MTDCALAATTLPSRTARRTARRAARGAARRPRRTLPGIPSWTRLFGVTAVPVEPHDPHGPEAWVISAGVGTGHIAALVHVRPDDRPSGH